MRIGKFTYHPDYNVFSGQVYTPSLQIDDVEIGPAMDGPDFAVHAHTPLGFIGVGHGYHRSECGVGFIEITLDTPALPKPVRARLYTDYKWNEAELRWVRSEPLLHLLERQARCAFAVLRRAF